MKWMHWMVFAAVSAAGSAQAVTFGACPANATAADKVTAGPVYTGVGWESTSGGNAVAVETAYKHNAWATPTNGSWLSPPMGTDTSLPYVYTMTDPVVVDESKIDPSSITVSGDYGADNIMQGLLVNGNSLGLPTGGGFSSFTNFAQLSTLGMIDGNNTIAFQIMNSESSQTGGGPMGLWAGFTFTANCKAQVIPPPGAGATPVPATDTPALLAMAASLAALGAWRSRRRAKASQAL